jgi:hypothetical protein
VLTHSSAADREALIAGSFEQCDAVVGAERKADTIEHTLQTVRPCALADEVGVVADEFSYGLVELAVDESKQLASRSHMDLVGLRHCLGPGLRYLGRGEQADAERSVEKAGCAADDQHHLSSDRARLIACR